MRITGTNGQLPRKALESTLLDRVVKTGKVPVRVLNVTAPTMPLYPPANDRFHWRVMSHLGSNFLSMMDNPEVLRGTLALYDWTDDEMNRRRLEAIVAVKHTLDRRFEKGFMLRGVDIEVTLNMDNFAGEGDVNLFGEMLHRFFALYADIHLFNQLTLVLQPTGKRWPLTKISGGPIFIVSASCWNRKIRTRRNWAPPAIRAMIRYDSDPGLVWVSRSVP